MINKDRYIDIDNKIIIEMKIKIKITKINTNLHTYFIIYNEKNTYNNIYNICIFIVFLISYIFFLHIFIFIMDLLSFLYLNHYSNQKLKSYQTVRIYYLN